MELGLEQLRAIAEHQMNRWSSWRWMHCVRVANISRHFAAHLQKSVDDQNLLFYAGSLHDWGQLIAMDRGLDWKPHDALSDVDIQQIRLHPEEARLMVNSLGRHPALADLIVSHHCRLPHRVGRSKEIDCGYPCNWCKNLKFTDLHWILILSDIYDAMTGRRDYRAPISKAAALLSIRNDVAIGAIDADMAVQFVKWQQMTGDSDG